MSKQKLNTTNPESLIYENEILQLTVLGGIKLEGMDRMRATLKICLRESSIPPVRHNLDLYNDTQLEKLVRKVAERLEIGTSVISASLAELTEQLEAYRLERIKQAQPVSYQPKRLTAPETKEAMQLLESPDLLEKTNNLIGQSGVIGELGNRLLMYVIFTARKREEPLHIISLGASGTYLNYLQQQHTLQTAKSYMRVIDHFLFHSPNKDQSSYEDVFNYLADHNLRSGRVLAGIKKYFDYLLETGQRNTHPCKSLTISRTPKPVQFQELFTKEELERLLERKSRYLKSAGQKKKKQKTPIKLMLEGLSDSEYFHLIR